MESINKQENQKTIDDLVKAVNGNEKLKHDLDEAVENALFKTYNTCKTYYKNLDEFVNFLPKTIKKFFSKENLEKLGKGWKNFEIRNEDLEKLYEINLDQKTKTVIIAGFDVSNKSVSSKNEQRL